MAKILGETSQTTNVTRVSEGAEQYLRMLRDGTVGIADLIALWSLEGRIFTVSAGAATGPATFAAGALNTKEMDLHIVVPASVVIIPISWEIYFEAYGASAPVECMLQYGTGSVVGTATVDVPSSSNSSAGRASQCTCNVASATGTALTTVVEEIWHDGLQAAATCTSAAGTTTPFRWQPERFAYRASDTGILHIIGPSQQVLGWTAANVGTGFFQFKYVELPVGSVE